MPRPQVGDPAPAFEAPDQNGKIRSLHEFKGQRLVLYFYPKDDTPGCTAEACSLRDHYQSLLQAGYQILGISSDSPASHQKFITKFQLPFDLISDQDKTVHEAFGTWIQKSMYGRSYMGTDRVTFVIGPDGIIQEVIAKVDTKNHAAQILP
ncbi:MAG: thioredoxin-dependent thiol peroxidase [Bacteroidia bacterium]|jgi:peroxiredoxin Q/BCP|nr:thioredoxin-dependent thiol peroxidase [Bacteroidia bacterium]